MSADAQSAFSDEFSSAAAGIIRPQSQVKPRLPQPRQQTSAFTSLPPREHIATSNPSSVATVSFPYASLATPIEPDVTHAEPAINAVQKVQHQLQHVLADQITPLRLAGHLSVLAVAAIILLLSQVKIPDWNLSINALPGGMGQNNLAGASGNLALPRLLTTELQQESGNLESLQRIALPFTTAPERPRETIAVYTVQSGDTILGIAAKYGLEPETILWSNPKIEENPDRISIGDQVKVLPVNGVLHTVRQGDTLSSIATKYKVGVADITGYAGNALHDEAADLAVGSELVVPGGEKPVIAQQVVTYSSSAPAPASAIKGSGAFAWPTSGNVSQGYWGGHAAIDISSWTGAPVTAADGGYVSFVGRGWNSGYGNHIIVDHGNGYSTLYAHLNSIYVSPGENIARGQQIGAVGNTGNSTGPHLHFEILYQGVRRNPYSFLP